MRIAATFFSGVGNETGDEPERVCCEIYPCASVGVETILEKKPMRRRSWPGRSSWKPFVLLFFLFFFVLVSGWQLVPAQDKAGVDVARQYYDQGVALIKQHRVREAIKAFQQGVRADPQNPILLNATGAAYSLAGDHREARACFLKALSVDHRFVPARKNLAIEYYLSGEYDQAKREFAALAQGEASRSFADLFLGIIAEKQGLYQQAAKFLEKTTPLVFQYPDGIVALAWSLEELHQRQRSEAILDRLGSAQGVSALNYKDAGILYSKLGRYKKALQSLDKARLKDPGLPHVDFQRAGILYQMGDFQKALDILRPLTAKKPDPDSLNLLAHVAEKAGYIQLAFQSLKKAAELDPRQEVNYLDFSTMCMDHGNYLLALDAANIGLANIPHSYRLMVQKGAVLDQLGRWDEAERTMRAAARLTDENSEAIMGLAVIQDHAHQIHNAIQTLNSGLMRFPDNYYMNYYLGKLFVQVWERQRANSNVAAKARQALKRAIQVKPAFAPSYFELAKLYVEANPKLAEQYLLMCLKLDPKYSPAEYELGRLYVKLGRRRDGEKLIYEFIAQEQANKLKEKREARVDLIQP